MATVASGVPAVAPAVAGEGGRLFYLDAVRAFAMLFGIVVHGTTIATPYIEQMPVFWGIQEVSDLFRNATFFLMSGIFTALVFTKRNLGAYARSRFELLAVPLAMGMIFIVPITNWLVHTWHNGPETFPDYISGGMNQPTRGNDTWALHLWFLYSLLIYAALTPLIVPVITKPWFQRVLNAYLDRTRGFTLWTNVLVFSLGIVLGRAAYDQGLRYLVEDTLFAWIGRATLFYLPVFILGAISFTNRRFLESMSKLSIPGLVIFGVLFYIAFNHTLPFPRPIERTLYWLIRGGLTLFMVSAVIWFFKTWLNKPSRALSFAVDSAYSFYLWHFTFIYLVAWATRAFTDDLYVSFVCIVLFGTPLTLAWHAFVINRWPLLRFLFTGKRVERAKAASPAP